MNISFIYLYAGYKYIEQPRTCLLGSVLGGVVRSDWSLSGSEVVVPVLSLLDIIALG